MFRHLIVGGCSLALFGLICGAPAQGGVAKKHHHPHMHHALHELKEARHELKGAGHDFGGHREKALLAIEDAIRQIEVALASAGDPVKKHKHNPDHYKKYTHHPHLHHAIHELKEARVELKEASHNFGGHREAALRDVNVAIVQLELALKHAKRV